MATTRAALLQELVQELFPEQYAEFAALAASSTTLLQANELHHEDASENSLDPGWVYLTAGEGAGDERSITAYEPRASVTYGTVAPHRPFSADLDATTEGFVYSGGLPPTQLLRHINAALRRSRRQRLVGYTMAPDGLMEDSGTSAWAGTNATLSKTASAPEGAQALRVVNSGAGGFADTANFVSSTGAEYQAEASVSVENATGSHTATLELYDVTNGAVFASVSTDSRTRVRISVRGTLPAGCLRFKVNLKGSGATTSVVWDQLHLWLVGQTVLGLPSTITKFDQVLDVYQRMPIGPMPDGTGPYGGAYDLQRLPSWVLRADPTASTPFLLDLSRSGWDQTLPIVVECLLPWPELAADTDSTSADKDDVLLRAKALAYSQLARLSPREDRKFYQEQADRLATTWSRAASRQPRPAQPVKGPRSSGSTGWPRRWWRDR